MIVGDSIIRYLRDKIKGILNFKKDPLSESDAATLVLARVIPTDEMRIYF